MYRICGACSCFHCVVDYTARQAFLGDDSGCAFIMLMGPNQTKRFYGSFLSLCTLSSLLGATGRHEGRKCPTSCQINSCNRSRCNFSFSNVKSNGASATGSSSGLCNCDKKGCASASLTVILFLGCISSIFRIKSNASNGVFGN